jgi:hypothetical protein
MYDQSLYVIQQNLKAQINNLASINLDKFDFKTDAKRLETFQPGVNSFKIKDVNYNVIITNTP